MIFSRDKSQMCNNLLQFAHVYAWGRAHGRRVVSMRFSYKYKFFKISHTDKVGFLWYLTAKYLSALKLLPTADFRRADCDTHALERKMERHRHIVVSGWYARFYDDFIKYRAEIVDLFTIDSKFSQPVDDYLARTENTDTKVLRLGVHIRRGDYRTWADGRFFYDDDVYAAHINRYKSWYPDMTVHVYLSTNDPKVNSSAFQTLCPNVIIHNMQGNAPADLYLLSRCDVLIGPPSTFSLVASMYRDIPLYRMDSGNVNLMTPDAFRKFDFWFRRII